jgi:hypothetical protein
MRQQHPVQQFAVLIIHHALLLFDRRVTMRLSGRRLAVPTLIRASKACHVSSKAPIASQMSADEFRL